MDKLRLQYQGKTDGTVEAFAVNIKGERVMAIDVGHGVVYVTQDDMRKFIYKLVN